MIMALSVTILFVLVLSWTVFSAPNNSLSPLKRLLDGIIMRLPDKLDKAELFEPPYMRFAEIPKDQKVLEGSSVTFHCEVNAIPPPLIRWTFNGQPVSQGKFEAEDNTLEKLLNLGLTTIANGVTASKLTLDCVTPESAGSYACVADNGHKVLESKFQLEVAKSTSAVNCDVAKKATSEGKGSAPVIYMWTDSRLEREGATSQLFCRAKGNPEPKIFWTSNQGTPIENNKHFTILSSGDLLIKGTDFSLMGGYTCVAVNELGEDSVEIFFYPTEPEESMKNDIEVVDKN